MKLLYTLIILIIFSCDELIKSELIRGCTLASACNYVPGATEDDGSCLEYDCAGECGGDATEYECLCDGLTEVELWGEWYDIESTTYIHFWNQGLTGSIPPEIGCLTNLTELLLDDNQLTGEIPSEIGQLTKLEDMNLSYNQLTGEIPPEVCDSIESNNLAINNILDGNNLINTCE